MGILHPSISMQSLIRKYQLNTVVRLWALIRQSDKFLRSRLRRLILASIICSIIELFTLASIPFLIISLSSVSRPFLLPFQENLPALSGARYLLPAFIIIGAVCSYIFRTSLIKITLDLAADIGSDLSQKAYSNVIRYDLSEIKSHSTSDLIARFSYFDLLITTCLVPLLTSASNLLTIGLFLLVFSFYKPLLTLGDRKSVV